MMNAGSGAPSGGVSPRGSSTFPTTPLGQNDSITGYSPGYGAPSIGQQQGYGVTDGTMTRTMLPGDPLATLKSGLENAATGVGTRNAAVSEHINNAGGNFIRDTLSGSPDAFGDMLGRTLGLDPKDPNLDMANQLSRNLYDQAGDWFAEKTQATPNTDIINDVLIKGAKNLMEPPVNLIQDNAHRLQDVPGALWGLAEDAAGPHGMGLQQVASTQDDPRFRSLGDQPGRFGATMGDYLQSQVDGAANEVVTGQRGATGAVESAAATAMTAANAVPSGMRNQFAQLAEPYVNPLIGRTGQIANQFRSLAAPYVAPLVPDPVKGRMAGEQIAQNMPPLPQLPSFGGSPSSPQPYNMQESLRVFGTDGSVSPAPPSPEPEPGGPSILQQARNAISGVGVPSLPSLPTSLPSLPTSLPSLPGNTGDIANQFRSLAAPHVPPIVSGTTGDIAAQFRPHMEQAAATATEAAAPVLRGGNPIADMLRSRGIAQGGVLSPTPGGSITQQLRDWGAGSTSPLSPVPPTTPTSFDMATGNDRGFPQARRIAEQMEAHRKNENVDSSGRISGAMLAGLQEMEYIDENGNWTEKAATEKDANGNTLTRKDLVGQPAEFSGSNIDFDPKKGEKSEDTDISGNSPIPSTPADYAAAAPSGSGSSGNSGSNYVPRSYGSSGRNYSYSGSRGGGGGGWSSGSSRSSGRSYGRGYSDNADGFEPEDMESFLKDFDGDGTIGDKDRRKAEKLAKAARLRNKGKKLSGKKGHSSNVPVIPPSSIRTSTLANIDAGMTKYPRKGKKD